MKYIRFYRSNPVKKVPDPAGQNHGIRILTKALLNIEIKT